MNTKQINGHNRKLDKLMRDLNKAFRQMNEATDRFLEYQKYFNGEIAQMAIAVNGAAQWTNTRH